MCFAYISVRAMSGTAISWENMCRDRALEMAVIWSLLDRFRHLPGVLIRRCSRNHARLHCEAGRLTGLLCGDKRKCSGGKPELNWAARNDDIFHQIAVYSLDFIGQKYLESKLFCQTEQ